jgi:hypothetical protein
LSFDTLVLNPAYGNLPGVEYVSIKTGIGTFKFAQPGPNNEYRGILPSLLDELVALRKEAKKKMAEYAAKGDEFMTAVMNARQVIHISKVI